MVFDIKLVRLFFLLVTLSSPLLLRAFVKEDVGVIDNCDSMVKQGDHVMFDYTLYDGDNKATGSLEKYLPRLHVVATGDDSSFLQSIISGMCKSATRKVHWDSGEAIEPIDEIPHDLQNCSSMTVTVHNVTDPIDFDIFVHLENANSSAVYEMLVHRRGAVAIDQHGQSPLMIATAKELMSSFSYLMSARMPKAEINYAKPNGYTALFYSIKAKKTSMLKALLQRGADPTVTLLGEGMAGVTPLHLALEKAQLAHAELLLQYGADPDATTESGKKPWDLLPTDIGRSLRKQYKKILEVASEKKASEKANKASSTEETETEGVPDL